MPSPNKIWLFLSVTFWLFKLLSFFSFPFFHCRNCDCLSLLTNCNTTLVEIQGSPLQFMAGQVGRIYMQTGLSILENDVLESSCLMLAPCAIQRWSSEPSLSGQASKIDLKFSTFPKQSSSMKRHGWKIAFALDTGGVPGNGDSPNLGGTRLGRIVSAGSRQLLGKLKSARKNFPMKIFLLLLGFYTANALATILGQTGDWDVLVAGVVVAAIEGIGMLM